MRRVATSNVELEQLQPLGKKLVSLEIEGSVSDAGLAALGAFGALEELNLTGSRVGVAGLVHLSGLRNLKRLWLCNTRVSDKGLPQLSKLTKLELLNLRVSRVVGSGLAALAPLRRLKFLGLDFTAVADAALMQLAALPRLETLDLGDSKVTGSGFASPTGFRKLKALSLQSTPLTEEGLGAIGALPALTELLLQKTRATDAWMAQLVPSKKLRKLVLAFRSTRAGADLTQLARLSQLRELWLLNHAPTEQGFENLESLSKLERAGADRVVNPQELGAQRMASFVAQPNVADYVDIVMHERDRTLRLQEVEVPKGSPVVGRSLDQLDLRASTGAMVFAVRGPDGSFVTNPDPAHLLAAGQVLIAIGNDKHLGALASLVSG